MSILDFLTYQAQASEDDWDSMYELGLCYANGNGTDKNPEEAFECFLNSAKHGHKEAQYAVATCYDCGRGVKENPNEALYWYEKSAQQKNAQALYKLGCLHIEGTPLVNKNKIKGLDFILNAYKLGLKDSEAVLTFLYKLYKTSYPIYKGKRISDDYIFELSNLVENANSGDEESILIINSIL